MQVREWTVRSNRLIGINDPDRIYSRCDQRSRPNLFALGSTIPTELIRVGTRPFCVLFGVPRDQKGSAPRTAGARKEQGPNAFAWTLGIWLNQGHLSELWFIWFHDRLWFFRRKNQNPNPLDTVRAQQPRIFSGIPGLRKTVGVKHKLVILIVD